MKTENYIETVYRELTLFENDEYKHLYETFQNEKLSNVFSTLHHLLIENFKKMNTRLPTDENTNHFWADPSRELTMVIGHIQELDRVLKGTKFSFKLEEYHKKIIEKVKSFLTNSGGSQIPPHMDKVELYYLIPIFVYEETINIETLQHRVTATKKYIGEGSYAIVYEYYDNFYNRKFVIKSAKKDLTEDELDRFKIEFETLSKFKSPYIIEVYKYIAETNEYIMEYMDIDLHDYIIKNNDTISTQLRKNLIRQILKGMEEIHSKNLLHRDINPKNILIKYYDDVNIVKVSDFGLVKNPENEMTNLDTNIKGYFNDNDNLSRVGFHNYSIEHETFAITKLVSTLR